MRCFKLICTARVIDCKHRSQWRHQQILHSTVPYGRGIWEKEPIIGVQWFQKNPNPRVHRSVRNSASLVSHWNGGPSGWDFSVPTEHQWWILFILHTPVPAKNEQPHAGPTSIRDVVRMLSWRHVASHRIQDFLEVFFQVFSNINEVFSGEKKKNPFFVWGWDRKSRPSLSPIIITEQASWCQSFFCYSRRPSI